MHIKHVNVLLQFCVNLRILCIAWLCLRVCVDTFVFGDVRVCECVWVCVCVCVSVCVCECVSVIRCVLFPPQRNGWAWGDVFKIKIYSSTQSRFLKRFRSDLTHSFLYLKDEPGPTESFLRTGPTRATLMGTPMRWTSWKADRGRGRNCIVSYICEMKGMCISLVLYTNWKQLCLSCFIL